MAAGLELARKKPRQSAKGLQFIHFLRAGEPSMTQTKARWILATASDWEMQLDLWRQLKFPAIPITNLRPDFAFWTKATKQAILVKLTMSWEERIEEEHAQEVSSPCQQKRWRAWNLPMEVSCRSFAGKSLWQVIGQLGIKGMTIKQLIASMTKQAEVASHWIWLNHNKLRMKPQVI